MSSADDEIGSDFSNLMTFKGSYMWALILNPWMLCLFFITLESKSKMSKL